jgi:hypothetical protein
LWYKKKKPSRYPLLGFEEMHDAKPAGVAYKTRFPEGAEYGVSEGFLYLPGGFYS